MTLLEDLCWLPYALGGEAALMAGTALCTQINEASIATTHRFNCRSRWLSDPLFTVNVIFTSRHFVDLLVSLIWFDEWHSSSFDVRSFTVNERHSQPVNIEHITNHHVLWEIQHLLNLSSSSFISSLLPSTQQKFIHFWTLFYIVPNYFIRHLTQGIGDPGFPRSTFVPN